MLGLYGKKDIKADPKFFGFRRKIQNKFANNKNPPYICNHKPKIYLFMTYEQYLESKKERVAQSGFSISDDELNHQLFPYNKGIL